jgi:SOS-response transcriptional repressor LexA
MVTLGQRVEAAIKASGKTAAQVAREAGTTSRNLSQIVTGENANPKYQLLEGIAQATQTTVGALAGNSIRMSAEDEAALLGFRDWIDGKLATIDALTEPNAEIIPASILEEPASRIADGRFQQSRQSPFGDANLVLRAIGDSMRDAGILSGDTLYATTRLRSAEDSAIGKIVACRIGGGVFVKRLTSERRRHLLLSAHPRYRAIEIGPDDPEFVILGVIVGRMGRVK